jgi:hypothetical protein
MSIHGELLKLAAARIVKKNLYSWPGFKPFELEGTNDGRDRQRSLRQDPLAAIHYSAGGPEERANLINNINDILNLQDNPREWGPANYILELADRFNPTFEYWGPRTRK